MPTLELLKLQLKPGVSATSPRLLAILSSVRLFVKTNSRFYTCIEDNSLLYILGEWPSLEAHKAFLSSPERETVLKPQEEVADFAWCEHIEMSESMNTTLPLDAQVLALARLWIKPDATSCEKFEKLMRKYRDEIVTGSSAEVLFDGWRVDQVEGEKEYVVLSGWDSQKHHLAWEETTRRDIPEYAGMGKYYDVRNGEAGVEVVHLKDAEKMVAKGEGA
jgi:heme-degrading monooxygenase HmoA